jgi:hypothetical protein
VSRTSRERYTALRQSAWRHPKVRKCSKGARSLYFMSLSYVPDFKTDGVIPSVAVSMLDGTKTEVAELLAIGLWEASGEDYNVHSYLEHNPSDEEMETVREARRLAGAKGGRRKAERVASATAAATANGVASASQALEQTPTKNVPDIESESDRESDTTPSGVDTPALTDTFEAKRGHLLRAHRDRYESATGNPVPSGKNAPQAVDRVVSWLAGYALRTGQSFPDAVDAVLGRWWADPYATRKGWPLALLAKDVDQFAEALPAKLAVIQGGMLRPGTHAEHAADAAAGGAPWDL